MTTRYYSTRSVWDGRQQRHTNSSSISVFIVSSRKPNRISMLREHHSSHVLLAVQWTAEEINIREAQFIQSKRGSDRSELFVHTPNGTCTRTRNWLLVASRTKALMHRQVSDGNGADNCCVSQCSIILLLVGRVCRRQRIVNPLRSFTYDM